MDIKVLASGSTGNCYKISDGETALILECGIPLKEIEKGLAFALRDIQGCLVTHEHKDHSKAILDVMKASVDVYTSEGTIKTLSLNQSHRLHVIKALQQFYIGTWTILPFSTEHDATEPLGFLLYSNLTHEKLLFATDTYYVRYKFTGLTHTMIECNYSADVLNNNLSAGLLDEQRKRRIMKSHFELSNVIGFLKANDLSSVNSIYLIHLSEQNSNADYFKKRVMAATGIPTYVAEKNGGVT
jgi:phosphoribosyl 1,2-cyclic phosphodiesterase